MTDEQNSIDTSFNPNDGNIVLFKESTFFEGTRPAFNTDTDNPDYITFEPNGKLKGGKRK